MSEEIGSGSEKQMEKEKQRRGTEEGEVEISGVEGGWCSEENRRGRRDGRRLR